MRRLLKIVFYLVLLIVVIAGAGVGAFFLAPSATLASFASNAVRDATGRELTVEGEIERTLYPNLGVKTGPVRLSNADWAEDPTLVSAQAVELSVRLMPLFSNRVEVETLRLIEPVARLEVREDGVPSWEMGESASAGGGQGGGGSGGGGGGDGFGIRLPAAEIVDGSLRYFNRQTGQRFDAEDVDLSIALPDIAKSLSIDGGATLNGTRATLTGGVDSPQKLQNGETVAADLKLAADGLNLSFSGSGRAPTGDGPPDLSGAFAFDLAEDPQLTAWLRQILPPDFGELGAIKLAGDVAVGAQGLSVDVAGDADLRGQATALVAKADGGDGWFDGASPVRLDVSAKNGLLDIGFDGAIERLDAAMALADGVFEGVPGITGDFRVRAPDVPAAADWAHIGPFDGQHPFAKLKAVNVSGDLALADDAAKAVVEGVIRYNERRLDLAADVSGGSDWRQGGPVQVALSADSKKMLQARFDGVIRADAVKPSAEGALSFSSEALRPLIRWAGVGPIDAPKDAFRALSLETDIVLSTNAAELTNARARLDDASIAADVSVDTPQDGVPNIVATVAADKLDLRPFFRKVGPEGAGAGGGQAPGRGKATRQSGWSEEPIDASALRAFNLTYDATLGGLITEAVRLGPTKVAGALQNGQFTAKITELGLYGGQVTGDVALDARAAPAVDLDLDVANVRLEPLLTQLGDTDRLSGRANIDLNIAGRGASMRALMGSLAGDADIRLQDVAVKGVSISDVARSLNRSLVSGGEGRTEFASVTATLQVSEGVARNADLSAQGPLVRATGAGDIDIGRQRLDYRAEPRAVASLQGQGGAADLRGLTIPVRIHGPWAALQYEVDLAGGLGEALRNPGAALQGVADQLQIDGLGEALGGDGVGAGAIDALIGGGSGGAGAEGDSGAAGALTDVLGGALGGGSDAGQGAGAAPDAPPPSVEDKAKDALKGLFGD